MGTHHAAVGWRFPLCGLRKSSFSAPGRGGAPLVPPPAQRVTHARHFPAVTSWC
ncbi:MAG: hypothetical protein PHV11_00010 [Candidatus Bipolaricaulis sp.]|nr:hypothetical protein [Candidatus Bipolaricaulis sp.]